MEFDIVPYRDIKESLDLANRILNVLVAAGWQYKPPTNGAFLMGGIEGVKVFRHPDADDMTKRAVTVLISSLTTGGIEARLEVENPINNPKHNSVTLSVGTKP